MKRMDSMRDEERSSFLADVVGGLSREEKSIPCKWLYDRRGSRLFDAICDLDAYYPTRTEIAITRAHAHDIANLTGPSARLVELGSGSSLKTRILLDHLARLHAYVPVDISTKHLRLSCESLAREYPALRIQPLAADYHRQFSLPPSDGERTTVVYFPGSTIGNFEPEAAVRFLRRMRELATARGSILIGTDLVKDVGILEAAYNDSKGITAEFNLNILYRMKNDLGAAVKPDRFRHRAFFERKESRIVMQLVSEGRNEIRIDDKTFALEDGEAITTEYSYKYEPEGFARMAKEAGLRVSHLFRDPRGWFGLHWLTPS